MTNTVLLKKWVHAVKRKNFFPSLYSKLCSDHFLPTDILDRPGTYKKHLKADAVPSIFSGFPSYQTIPKMPRRTLKRKILQEDVSTNTVVDDSENLQMIMEPHDVYLV